MKFARYLEDTHTPEWKRAYIDYRKLKRCIREISDAQLERASGISPNSAGPGLSPSVAPVAAPNVVVPESQVPGCTSARPPAPVHPSTPSRTGREGDRLNDSGAQVPTYGSYGHTPPLRTMPSARGPEPVPPMEELPPPAQDLEDRRISTSNWQTDPHKRFEHPPNTQAGTHVRIFPAKAHPRAFSTTDTSPQGVYSLDGIYRSLSPLELRFFRVLDEELNKVEEFYLEREKELVIFSSLLNEQLHELEVHRRIYHEVQDKPTVASGHWSFIGEALANMRIIPPPQTKARVEDPSDEFSNPRQQIEGASTSLDPDQYQQSKKKLKKAILEHYHGIELLNNYRVLNLTGFRKALKKLEKVTHIPAQQPYMNEKVDNCAFASDTKMLGMISNVESLYALHFTNGNMKIARERLRDTTQRNTQHSRSFRSGLCIGLGIPALSRALYLSFQEETRATVPAWAVLLQVYGGFLLPIILALLIGGNMLVWQRHRINYVFIFEFDVRTVIDPRQFVEIPAILFLTLSYSALLSFGGSGSIAATTWPLAWLGFTICFILNPLPMFAKSSRYWFVRKFSKLFVSGLAPVEFSDFWLGDQFCSLAFSLASLWTLACSVHNGWAPDSYDKCGLSHHWPTPFVLSCLPSLIRFLQCVRRYSDSGLSMHMINGGKYLSSVVYYVLYFLWRHNGAKIGNTFFILFCLGGSVTSLYTSAWDLLVDWSLFDPAAEYRLLRPELLYRDNILDYYFAIVSNVLIRCLWFCYFLVPSGLNITPRTFIVACLEILRRAHWNTYRLENEHIGNMDQYRVTREVPLPYHFQDDVEDDRQSTGSGNSYLGRLRKPKPPPVCLPQMDIEQIPGAP